MFESRFLEILSKNSRAFSLGSLNYFSFPIRSYNLAPVSVIYSDSSLADLRLCNFELMLKSSMLELSSSSILDAFIALYSISTILTIYLTAKFLAS